MLWANESEEELEVDQSLLVIKRRHLMATRKMFSRFFTRAQPRPNDEVNVEASIGDMVNTTENVTTVTCHDEADGVTIESSIDDKRAADRINSSSGPELDQNSIDQILKLNDDASDTVADEVIRAADDSEPFEKKTTVECITTAQKVGSQCSTVVNELLPSNATANEPKTTSVLHNIEG